MTKASRSTATNWPSWHLSDKKDRPKVVRKAVPRDLPKVELKDLPKAVRKAEGRAEGLAEGERRKQLEIARNLKQMGLATEAIAQATGLTAETIEAL